MAAPEQFKVQITQELTALEKGEKTASPVATVRSTKALLARLREQSRWDDSRSSIAAGFLNLIRDRSDHEPYLKYTDVSARANALLALSATKLTPSQAQAEGVMGLHRMSSQAAEAHFATTQRLSRPGGAAAEIARETPQPFVEEAVRRGGQVKDVGARVAAEAAPVGQGLVDELDKTGVTNPALGIISLGMIVFMKNKLLAIILILLMIFLTKQKQIKEVKRKITSATETVTGAAETVTEVGQRLSS
jgi:hypothetical protein